MRLATNIIVAGGTIAAAVLLKMVVRYRRGKHGAHDEPLAGLAAVDPDGELTVATISELVAVATESGLAEVDPEPISHVAGEGIDLDRDIAAHEVIAELRARLPR